MTPALLAIALGAAAPAQVTLRAEREPTEGEIASVSASGVELRSGGETRMLHWGQVKLVEGAFAGEADAFRAPADALWRGVTRLRRGDATGAEAMFERALDGLGTAPGYSRLVASSGLAECARRRGDNARAVGAWLEVLAISRQIWSTIEGADALLVDFDTQTGLSRQIPPIWLGEPSARVFLEEGPSETVARSGDDVVMTIDRLYRAGAEFESLRDAGLDPSVGVAPPPENQADLPGVEMVWLAVSSRIGNEQQREAARSEMLGRVDGAPGDWREAWMRTAIGRSLLIERVEADRDRGLVHLLHVPARFGFTQPYLSGIALAEIALELESRGRTDEGRRVRAVLAERYPGHPANEWLREQRRGARDGNDQGEA